MIVCMLNKLLNNLHAFIIYIYIIYKNIFQEILLQMTNKNYEIKIRKWKAMRWLIYKC